MSFPENWMYRSVRSPYSVQTGCSFLKMTSSKVFLMSFTSISLFIPCMYECPTTSLLRRTFNGLSVLGGVDDDMGFPWFDVSIPSLNLPDRHTTIPPRILSCRSTRTCQCSTRRFGLVNSVAPGQIHARNPETSAGTWTRYLQNQLRCLRQLVIALPKS